jgi:hypothetical protein
MSEIFYSQVDAALQAELNARGRAGKTDRSTKGLNFMLGKIANVELIAYEDQNREKPPLHTLGGAKVRSGEYLPTGTTQFPGFLDNRQTEITKNSWKTDSLTGEIKVKTETDTLVNSSKRIPPYITSTDINIGDHSMGLLNKATVNINIPNPQQDLDFFEYVWLRPGRHVLIVVEHPESAVITDGSLTTALASTEKIKELNPYVSDRDLENFKKLNRYEFYGLITNWNFIYNEDASVSATINLTGTSNVYTDVSLLMSPSNEKKNDVPINIDVDTSIGTISAETQATTTNAILNFFNPSGQVNFLPTNFTPQPIAVPPPTAETGSDGEPLSTPLPIYDDLETEVQTTILASRLEQTIISEPISVQKEDSPTMWAINGKPYDSGSIESETYITLNWLVDYMNRVIINKLVKGTGDENGDDTFTENIKIICDDSVCTSNYYASITSANPSKILLMDKNSETNTYGSLTWYESLENFPSYQEDNTAYPARIFINIELIHDIIEDLSVGNTEFNINNFFKEISYYINYYTGTAVNLSLVTHPERTTALLYYDAHRVLTKNNNNVIPYAVPMFANDPNGTVVQSFGFNAKIPDSVKNLSYVLNQNPEEISELDIAPYMNFMYNSSEVIRTNRDAKGVLTETQNPNAEANLQKLKERYKQKHETYVRDLNKSKIAFGLNPTDSQRISELRQAIIRYIQYPTPILTQTNQLTAPIFPFDADITIDGINGFRYGDVLEFLALPERYRKNTVFTVINVTHIINNNGQWLTKLKCIMRPRFE